MAPRKGFSLFTRVISDELNSLERYWYILSSSLCGGSPSQYFRKNVVVQNFPEEFKMIERASLRQVDGSMFDGNVGGSDFVVVASSFGFLVVLLRQQFQKSSWLKDPGFELLKSVLNDLDFSALSPQHEEIIRGTPFPDPATIPSRDQPKPHVARKLSLNSSSRNAENAPPMTPKQSGQNGKQGVSPNIKDICQNPDIETPEKELLIKKRGQQLISQVNVLCEEKRESLSTVLSYLCAFGDNNATGLINDVIEDVASRKGVKRAIQDLAGEETYARYIESLRVPDWEKKPKQSGQIGKQGVSPNIKDICQNPDIETPEKELLLKKRGQQLIIQVNVLCEEKRESLSTVLSCLCAFGDNNATGLINDVIEDVALRKGVKRAIQDLAGEETYARYIESLRVPDWVLLFFKTRGRISGHTWQTVINITQL